jgi:hypothetical protein
MHAYNYICMYHITYIHRLTFNKFTCEFLTEESVKFVCKLYRLPFSDSADDDRSTVSTALPDFFFFFFEKVSGAWYKKVAWCSSATRCHWKLGAAS